MSINKKLTKEEQEILDELRPGFNIVDKEFNSDIEFGKKFHMAKYWTEKILKMSYFLLIASLIFFIIGFIFYINKPKPYVYGSSSDNSLFLLEVLEKDEAIDAINKKAYLKQLEEQNKVEEKK